MASIRKSLFLSYLDKYSSLIIGTITTLILARLLTPYEIGVYSIAGAAVGLAGTLRDFGISSYLISEKELTVERQRSAMGVSLIITWSIGIVLAGSSGWVADIYGNPGVQQVILVLSLNFFLIPLTMVVITVLRREMQFGTLYRISLVTTLSRTITVLTLAWFGWGFMAMAWSSVAGMAATFVMGQIELPAVARLLPSFREWRRIVSFGVSSAAGQILGAVNEAAANMLIGRILSPAATGFYSRAVGMIMVFQQAVNEGIAPVALSVIAMQNREQGDVAGLMLRGLTHITALGWPFFCFVAFLTFPVIRVLFGDQWDAAVPLARLVCIAAMIGLLDAMTWATMQGTGYVGKYAIIQAFTVPTNIVLLFAALLHWGTLEAIGWVAIIGAILHVVASLAMLRKLVHLPILGLARAVSKSAGIAIASSIGPAAVVATMPIGPDHVWIPLIVAGVGAGFGFLGAIFALKHPLADEIKEAWGTGRRYVLG